MRNKEIKKVTPHTEGNQSLINIGNLSYNNNNKKGNVKGLTEKNRVGTGLSLSGDKVLPTYDPDGAVNPFLINDNPRGDIKKQVQGWLNKYHWQWYATFTFREDIQFDYAIKILKRFIRIYINERWFGKRYREHKKGIKYYWVAEFQKRGVVHFHLLIQGIPKERYGASERLFLMKAWENFWGVREKTKVQNLFGYIEGSRVRMITGFARIFLVKRGRDTANITKYVAKDFTKSLYIKSTPNWGMFIPVKSR